MSIFNYYYSGKIAKIREELIKLNQTPNGKKAIESSKNACILLEHAPLVEYCNWRMYYDYLHTLQIIQDAIDASAGEKLRSEAEHFHKVFKKVVMLYQSDAEAHMVFNDEDRTMTYDCKAPHLSHLRLVLPYSMDGVIVFTKLLQSLRDYARDCRAQIDDILPHKGDLDNDSTLNKATVEFVHNEFNRILADIAVAPTDNCTIHE